MENAVSQASQRFRTALCANRSFGFFPGTQLRYRNSAAYIQSWLKALKNDNKMIVWAAKKAEEAARYILNEVPVE